MTNDSFRSSGFAAYCERLGAGDALDRAFRAGGTLANCHPQLAQGCGSLAAQRSVAHPHRRGLTMQPAINGVWRRSRAWPVAESQCGASSTPSRDTYLGVIV